MPAEEADTGTAGPAGAGEAPARLVLVLGGTASLGAYAAGAARELLKTIEADARAGVRVHAIVGSSAGALNAAVAVRALAVNPGLLGWLRKLWVELLDVEVLLDPRRSDPGALFDGDVLEELSRALIAGEPASDDRPARSAADPLRLGIALSNLTGVPRRFRYRSPDGSERSWGARDHRDAVSFEVPRGTRAGAAVWEEIRRAATASAAFPFVWPPHALERSADAYPEASFEGGASERRMWFADAGLLGGGPLRLAKRLVERAPDHPSARWRYVLVDPGLGEGDGEPGRPDTPLGLADALAEALLGRSAARDRVRAVDASARVELLEAIVHRLPELADRLCDPEAFELGREVAGLAQHVAELRALRVGRPSDDEALEALDRGLRRIESDPRFEGVLARVGTRAARTRLAKLIYVLEAMADLEDERELPLHVVEPPPGERLAGAFLGGLGGFLGPAWRRHDFEAGRRDAARLLKGPLSDLVRYERDPEEIRPPDPPPPSLEAAPAEVRERVDRYVDLEVDRFLESVEPGAVGRLLAFAWKPAIRSSIRLRVRGALERASRGGGARG